MSLAKLEELVTTVVRLAKDAGATDSEATAGEGDEFETTVRLGEVEQVKEAGSRSIGVRVLSGKNVGSSYTSDLTPEGLRAMVAQAVELARIMTEDPHAGLPDADEFGSLKGDCPRESIGDDAREGKIPLGRRRPPLGDHFDPDTGSASVAHGHHHDR